MILKRPYAFFIKHFKLIHLLLTIMAIYVAFQTRPAVHFFREYVTNNYSTNLGIMGLKEVISPILFVILIAIIIMISAILWLFSYKKKKKTFYIFYVIYYVIFLITLIIARNLIISLATNPFTVDSARIYRDVAIIIYIPEFIFIIICIVRALGFNIKQFNFEKDLESLEINSQDNEEVEIAFGLDTYKAKKKVNKIKREFGYYVKENKLLVISLGVIIVGILTFVIIKANKSIDTSYKVGEPFIYNQMTLTIEDSIITNLDQGGNIIPNNKYYVLIKTRINNNSNAVQNLDYTNIKLKNNNNYITPDLTNTSLFADYGVPLLSSDIKGNTDNTYVIPYEISEKDIHNKFAIEMNNGESSNNSIKRMIKTTININPIIVTEIIPISTIKLNQNLNLSGTYLLNSSININDFQITDKYIYNYKVCITNDNCNDFKDIVSKSSSNETLLVLIGSINLDPQAIYSKNINAYAKFPTDFIKVEYTQGTTTYQSTVTNVTPSNYKEGYILKTNSNVTNSNKIDLLVTIRNKQYRINLQK